MEKAKFRIEVYYKSSDPRGQTLRRRLTMLGFGVDALFITDNYLINADISIEDAGRCAAILKQPVTQDFLVNSPYDPGDFDYALEIGFLPGVTDNVAHTVRESLEDLLAVSLDYEKSIYTSFTYFIKGGLTMDDAVLIGRELHNPLIQRIKILSRNSYVHEMGMGMDIPVVSISENPTVSEVEINLPEADLLELGRNGIPDLDGTRRGPLALDLASLQAIRNYYNNIEKRRPTDIELESIAQTWSEHCKHTIFAADMDDDVKGGIYRKYIKEATLRIRRDKGDKDFCLSVFSDNAGGIDFDDDYIIADKVETHNSPSALDPFGGSITGIVGVNRDIIGFGLGSKPVANRYGFCFSDPFHDRPLYRSRDRESRLLPSRRIMEGVIRGVNAGGNQSGIPTPQGFVYFDERYRGKPLVFVGTLGLMPKIVNGRNMVMKKAMPGDNIVVIGGRVGRDGIHGATFSSEALSSGSPASAVQIGDPITQKKLSDAVVKEARDLGLYNSITDNGAGGLSCSVAEMARESGGFEVDLEKIPLKYPGLSPWQIWVSESQERMTLSIPDVNLGKFLSLMNRRGVHGVSIGRFNGSDRGTVRLNGEVIFSLDMKFLHDGLPQKHLKTTYIKRENPEHVFPQPGDMNGIYGEMLERMNLCSYEFISTQYDHEVQGNSVIKPLQGKGRVNGNVSVIRPVAGSMKGVILSQGLYPSYSEIDPYGMAACSIDTAVRNVISAGGTMEKIALLDNFCWCDSNNPERLGQLKEAASACYDYSVAYGTPFISGKDSMFNDFKGYDSGFNEVFISVPPTLLISSLGIMEDISLAVSIDIKFSGDLIYILGLTGSRIGGSEYLAHVSGKAVGIEPLTGNLPEVDAALNAKLYRAYEKGVRMGLISSGISIERGGLGIAAAKSSVAGMLGFSIDLSKAPVKDDVRDDIILFSESQGRLLVTVDPVKQGDFESLMKGNSFGLLGHVSAGGRVEVFGRDGKLIIDTDVRRLSDAYRKTFREF